MQQTFDPGAMDLDGVNLIEASAGTGKTFALTGLYLRLIVEKKISVRDILVVTFTRPAAREMRERIRARLDTAAAIARQRSEADGQDPSHAAILAILDAVDPEDQTQAQVAERLTDAATRVDEATITTIHGFAHRASSENAFESALAFNRGERVDDVDVYREAATDCWREHILSGHGDACMRRIWPQPDDLCRVVVPVALRPHATIAGLDSQRLNDLKNRLAADWAAAVDTLKQALRAAFDADALVKSSSLYKALNVAATIEEQVDDLDAGISAAIQTGQTPLIPAWVEALADPVSQFKKADKSRVLADPLSAISALPILVEIAPLARCEQISHAVNVIRERAEQRKFDRRQYSYNDLVVGLNQALENPTMGQHLADMLAARWPYALVDEFQDTDPLQYASLSRIYIDNPAPGKGLVMIGDPKQAIYGFRGGDVYAYLTAANDAGNRRYTLDRNFRSTQGVIDATAALFGAPDSNPFLIDSIDMPAIVGDRGAGECHLVLDDSPVNSLSVWQMTGEEKHQKNGKIKNPSKGDDIERLQHETVQAIRDLVDADNGAWVAADGSRHPVAPSDIGVLVNSNDEAEAIQAALARVGVRAVCQHRNTVFGSAEASDVSRILQAMATPDDAGKVRAAQTTTLMGGRLSEAIDLADDDKKLQAEINRFQSAHETWRRHGVASALGAMVMDGSESVMALPDGERRMTNYQQLAELLSQQEKTSFGMERLARWLNERIAEERDGRASNVDGGAMLRLDADEDLVRVSTVHSSKGLEYPVVFMPYAGWLSASANADRPPLVFHETNGSGFGGALIDPVGQDADNKSQAALEEQAEKLRLLYVGMTRARDALFIGWRDIDDSGYTSAIADLLYRNKAPDDRGAIGELASNNPAVIDVRDINLSEGPTPVAPAASRGDTSITPARTDLPEKRTWWSAYSFSRLARNATGHASALPDARAADERNVSATIEAEVISAGDEPVPAVDDRLSGVLFGSVVHDLLQAALESHGQACQGVEEFDRLWRGRVADALRARGLSGADNDDVRVTDTLGVLWRTLGAEIEDVGALGAINAGAMRAEMPFMFQMGDAEMHMLETTLQEYGYLPGGLGEQAGKTLSGVMQGYIDLVIETDGCYRVVDYKTNRLGEDKRDYSQGAMHKAIAGARYDLQYLIYLVALHRHLRYALGDAYEPEQMLGGALYIFVRATEHDSGAGVYADRPPIELIDEIDALFSRA